MSRMSNPKSEAAEYNPFPNEKPRTQHSLLFLGILGVFHLLLYTFGFGLGKVDTIVYAP